MRLKTTLYGRTGCCVLAHPSLPARAGQNLTLKVSSTNKPIGITSSSIISKIAIMAESTTPPPQFSFTLTYFKQGTSRSETTFVVPPWSTTIYDPSVPPPITQTVSITTSAGSIGGSSSSLSNPRKTASPTSSSLPKSPATVVSATQAASTTKAPSSGSVHSDGAVAGIAIACAIVGAALASAILFCFFRRTRQKKSTSHAPPSSSELDLPQPVSDSEIKRKMNSLGILVKNHVASFYREPETTISQNALAKIVQRPQVPLPELVSSLNDARSRQQALQYLIASVLFTRIGPNSDPGVTFLPADLLSCFQSIQTSHVGQRGINSQMPQSHDAVPKF